MFKFLSQGNALPESLKQAALEFHSGKPLNAQLMVLRYFRSRGMPRFFVDANTIVKIAGEIQQEHPSWHVARKQRIESDYKLGLGIYSKTAPPLMPGFPWHAPAQGHGNDLLFPVRPHRFAFAPRMALLGLSEDIVIERLRAIIEDWLKFSETGRSNLPYVSNLVVIQRLLAVSWTWAFLAAKPFSENSASLVLEWELLKMMRVDVAYLQSRLGTSYPNNHLLVDRFAGWYIAQWLPEFFGKDALVDHETKWLDELQRQTLADGTGFEHSIHYHEFGCEMALAYYLLATRNHREVPCSFKQRLGQMLGFQADMGGPRGMVPAIGNTTEDPLFPLDVCEGWASAVWWAFHRELFDAQREPLHAADSPCLERAIWLQGKDFSQTKQADVPARPQCHAYPEGGYFVFCESGQSSRLIFRTGPATMTNISAGHMHADLLSLYLTVEAEPVLVDAGTYTYRNFVTRVANTDVNWRQYFAGPSAHNGPTIDNVDPHGPLVGDFRAPETAARVTITGNLNRRAASRAEARIESSNEYNGIVRGVVLVPDQYYVIYDALPEFNPKLDVSYGFQLSSESQVDVQAGSLFGHTNGQPWEINAGPGLKLAPLLVGRTDPLGGWVSMRYGDLASAPQARFRNDRSRTNTAFVIRAGKQIRHGEALRVVADDSRGGNVALKISIGRAIDYLIVRPSGRTYWGIDFEGDLLWLRTQDSRVCALRWLDGRSAKCQDMGLRVEAALPLPSLELEAMQPPTVRPNGLTHCDLG